MTLAGTLFKIAPTQTNVAGVYPVSITVTDGAQTQKVTQTLSVTISNAIPVFTVALADQTLFRGVTISYSLTVADPDGFSVIVSYTPIVTWITLAGSTFSISPLMTTPTGIYLITVTLFDGAMYATSTFNINVNNNPPVFNTPLPID